MRSSTTTWKKGYIRWESNNIVYFSIPFTWDVTKVIELAKVIKGSFFKRKIVVGGPGALLMQDHFKGLAEVRKNPPKNIIPLNMFNPDATFTTRGCINKCGFCAVSKIEGDLVEIPNFNPAPIICDNNLLAATKKHVFKVINSCKEFSLSDFNQGLEAKLFTKSIATKISEIKCILRFAFDNMWFEKYVVRAIERAKKVGFKEKYIRIYILYGYKDTFEETIYRCELVRKLGALPFPMRYQPLDSKVINEYVPKKWDERMLVPVGRYYTNCYARFSSITFDEYLDMFGSVNQKRVLAGKESRKLL